MSQTGLTDVLLKEKQLYKPSAKTLKMAKIKNVPATLKAAQKDPLKFWEEAATELEWFAPWKKVFEDRHKPFYEWFVGGKCNIVHNALDRHMDTPVEKKTAILWESDAGKHRQFTYRQLHTAVNKMANGLKMLGVKKGDRVATYLQNIPEAAITMLACAKIGAIHSVVYAGFSGNALATRLKDGRVKVLVTSNVGHRRGKVIDMKTVCDDALKQCHFVKKMIVVRQNDDLVKMKRNRDFFYHDLVDPQSDICKTVPVDSEHPLFILYTSGTTGTPKGIIHVHGGYMVGVNRSFQWAFDIRGDETYWCTADPGWITGHSYIVYAPLMAGITTLMFEGVPDYPRPDRIWKIVEKYKVNILYTAPTLIRALMRYGEQWPKKHDLSSLHLLGSVGEPINPEAWRWYHKNIGHGKCPIIDTWWQTETGMFMITPLPATPLKSGSATFPFPGIEVDVVDSKGNSAPAGKGGFLVIKNQWPSMLRGVYKDPARYKKTYWNKIKGVYFTGDLAHRDKDGYFWIQGRSDDVLSIAGHRIGSAEIESALVSHPAVVEAGVIGKPDEIKGERAKAFVILKKKYKLSESLIAELKKHVRSELGPIAVPSELEFVEKLPKTRSGKIMRRVLKAQELGEKLGDVSTLAD
ncbi:acetate--CoA ligase [Candidatus Peregrinibacteria bacterium CG_4_10_14_0_2_um_filter_43_11]|nr:MAG: acetate--CoA ligase [Candidatus Peregrinibacteria bacterium CG_4_10_14_0_2_um_filter_43_11]